MQSTEKTYRKRYQDNMKVCIDNKSNCSNNDIKTALLLTVEEQFYNEYQSLFC